MVDLDSTPKRSQALVFTASAFAFFAVLFVAFALSPFGRQLRPVNEAEGLARETREAPAWAGLERLGCARAELVASRRDGGAPDVFCTTLRAGVQPTCAAVAASYRAAAPAASVGFRVTVLEAETHETSCTHVYDARGGRVADASTGD